jgi:predicted glycoside hydrolase/deacetylase ChbG (UPF0249 family)
LTAPRLLIVTADDFGLTEGVCRAIVEAHRDGIVSATSVLGVGRALEYGAALLRDAPTLAVGAHLAMVGEDPPVLSAKEIPSLVGRRGAFPLSYRTVVRRGLAGRIDPDDVRREFGAQLERLRSVGLQVGHLDTHQHVHLWPAVGAVVTQLAQDQGIPAVRRPRSASNGLAGLGVRALGRRLDRQLDQRAVARTDAFAGLDEAGRLRRPQLSAALLRARDSGAVSVEVNCHPGESDDPDLDRFSWGYAWDSELAMLCDPMTTAMVGRLGFRLGTLADLPDGRADRT